MRVRVCVRVCVRACVRVPCDADERKLTQLRSFYPTDNHLCFDETSPRRNPSPAEHTLEILGEFGFDGERVKELLGSGAAVAAGGAKV